MDSKDTSAPDSPKLTWICLLYTFFASISTFQYGYKISELNTPKDAIINCSSTSGSLARSIISKSSKIPKCLPMSESLFALSTSIFAIGGFLGSFVSGSFCDRFGRKKTLLYNSFIYFLGSLLETLALHPIMLVVGRFISGFACGLAVVAAPMYLTEISPIKYRGTLNLINQLNIMFGIFCAQMMGYLLGSLEHWRLVLGFAVAASFVNFATMFLVVESPKYLLSINDYEGAKHSLTKLRGTSDVTEELDSWKSLETDINAQGAETNETEKQKINVFSIFKLKKYRHPVIIVILLQIGQQLSGISIVFSYSYAIFTDMFSAHISAVLTIMIGVILVVFCVVSTIVVDRMNRKTLLFLTKGGMFVFLLLFCVSKFRSIDMLSVVSLLVITAFFALGYAALPALITTELFDTPAIAAGTSISISVNWIAQFIIGVTFFSMQNAMGNYTFVFFLVTVPIFGAIYYFYLPETKNKTFDQISKKFVF
ncbi:hypothetical protein BB559_006573 [Furculomyces boomerangus]|uniref:Major facilitator superfamily (MFS) profile domain-containing protein n=2 Tax=Harpellales TaxID=61421 RepID=A0A2T9Y1R6_9FUNG|nr:hypothetical protein BB559_006573 [Furculomyces boomerangus]PVZ98810.1 hypothetical protein BB558_005187 [Smittium angustum]